MFKTKKGDFGYIKAGRIKEFIKALLMLGISLALYFGGIKATGSNKNVLTYVAILGCLPAAKFMVNFYMFMKAKGCTAALKESFDKAGIVPTFYDLYFTTYKVNYQVSAMYYNKSTLIGVTEDDKCDVTACEEHLQERLKSAGFELTVKIFKATDKFTGRVKELSELNSANENDNTFLFDNILNLSL
ncbi:MAG: hypothetical protein K6E19_02470 [Lachnospiraceae bacterium]|nr:hypothetical protein [Lachnospiraceae bacterium]